MSTQLLAGLTRRPATEADVPFLLALREQTMSHNLKASGIEPTAEEREARVRFRFDLAEILLLDGEPVGLWKLDREGQTWRLLQLQLSPSVQGLGIGGQLLGTLVEEVRAAGIGLSLGVLHTNPARRLYERHGFQIVDNTPHSYEMLLAAP
ncbi:GNAT family N-acetyltransferase [Chitinimonas naiadis]